MPVCRFHVAGYRSLADVSLELGAMTVIVGPNGSGKTNIYRALRLAQASADGRLARTIVQEGGMPSIVFGGHVKGQPKIELAVDMDDMSYELCLGTVGAGFRDVAAGPFPRDPVIKSEQILLPGPKKRRVEMLDRSGSTGFIRDAEGNRVTFPAEFRESESVLSQLVDARQFPELVYVRETLRRMRFHHQLRSDDDAPARRPGIATRTPAVSDDGVDLAAALLTIQREGDEPMLNRCIEHAFDGAELEVDVDEAGRLDILLHVSGMTRPLSAPELSDGQLRFLFLAATLLSQAPLTMVVLNEPETSLHVQLLPALAELVAAAAEQTQVVLTTHAAGLADSLISRGALGFELEIGGGTTQLSKL